MRSAGAVRVAVLSSMLFAPPLHAQTEGHYRDFQLGSEIAAVSTLTGVAASEAKTIRSRPATLQDLQWRRPYTGADTAADPVEQIAFSFYNNQLFRLAIDYSRDRTEGMTDADMVEAISTMYGAVNPALKAARATAAAVDEESGTRVAAWGGAEYTAVLYRSSSYGAGFRLIVTSSRLGALARMAEAQAVRLDERDAPQRERARQKKEADDERAAKAKARLVNKAAFKP